MATPRPRKAAAAKKVDETVVNQENPISSEKARESTDKVEETAVAKMAPANEVDEPVVNQEHPGTSDKDRGTTNPDPVEPEFAKMAPAQEVDITVVNQESLGAGEVVDRNPDPEIVENPITGASYDVSKSTPELIDPNKEDADARNARLRQTEGVMNAKDLVEHDEDKASKKIEIEFVESGLTAQGRVWKKGQVLTVDDNDDARRINADSEDNVWYEYSAEEQKERYGKVFFEKR